jgi:RNA polymerase sigma factor (sigma-70 family)
MLRLESLGTRERRRRTERQALAEWVGHEILPHERDVRRWLQRRFLTAEEVEDIVQECYCRLAQLSAVAHIASPRGYFFTMARNLAHSQRQRARVVRIDSIDDRETAELPSDLPLPDRIAVGRQELERVRGALATLSQRAQTIFTMRKIEGRSQKDIAATLGVSEAVVENEASRSLRAILRILSEPESEADRDLGIGGARAGSI